MGDILGAVAIAIVGGGVLALMFRKARELDRLEARYVEYIGTTRPDVALVNKVGGLYLVRINGLVYPSSVLEFYRAYRREPEALQRIMDEYLSSLPQTRKGEAG